MTKIETCSPRAVSESECDYEGWSQMHPQVNCSKRLHCSKQMAWSQHILGLCDPHSPQTQNIYIVAPSKVCPAVMHNSSPS